MNRFQKEVNGSGYVCIDQVVNSDGSVRPRTELGVGNFDLVEDVSDEYDAQHDGSPLLMIQFRDGTSQRYGILKVSSPAHRDDVAIKWLQYVGRLTHELVDHMRKQNPNAKLVGAATLLYTGDKAILNMLRRYVGKEVVKYQVVEPSQV